MLISKNNKDKFCKPIVYIMYYLYPFHKKYFSRELSITVPGILVNQFPLNMRIYEHIICTYILYVRIYYMYVHIIWDLLHRLFFLCDCNVHMYVSAYDVCTYIRTYEVDTNFLPPAVSENAEDFLGQALMERLMLFASKPSKLEDSQEMDVSESQNNTEVRIIDYLWFIYY